MPTYHLANIVDDHHMRISHVIRGEEWLPSAPLHVKLYESLGWNRPEFAHLSLILRPDGKGKLSKRDGDRLGFPVFPLEWKDPRSAEISSGYRESGYLPEAVINMLAFLGWHPSDHRELFSLDELIQAFSLERVSKSGAKFDLDKAKWFNHQFLMRSESAHLLEGIRDQLTDSHTKHGDDYLKKVIDLMKEKVNFSHELLERSTYFFEMPKEHDAKVQRKRWKAPIPAILDTYSQAIEGTTSGAEMESILEQVAEKHEVNKGSLMQPLRWAVSGEAGGPPLFEMLEVIGAEGVSERIRHTIATVPLVEES